MNDIDYNRIIKECFWDYNFSKEELEDISAAGSWYEKSFLFEKILLHSTRLLVDLTLFKPGELPVLLKKFKAPKFNNDYIFRRKNIAEVYFFNKPLQIDELKWLI